MCLKLSPASTSNSLRAKSSLVVRHPIRCGVISNDLPSTEVRVSSRVSAPVIHALHDSHPLVVCSADARRAVSQRESVRGIAGEVFNAASVSRAGFSGRSFLSEWRVVCLIDVRLALFVHLSFAQKVSAPRPTSLTALFRRLSPSGCPRILPFFLDLGSYESHFRTPVLYAIIQATRSTFYWHDTCGWWSY